LDIIVNVYGDNNILLHMRKYSIILLKVNVIAYQIRDIIYHDVFQKEGMRDWYLMKYNTSNFENMMIHLGNI
jgi:hypothetical protein